MKGSCCSMVSKKKKAKQRIRLIAIVLIIALTGSIHSLAFSDDANSSNDEFVSEENSESNSETNSFENSSEFIEEFETTIPAEETSTSTDFVENTENFEDSVSDTENEYVIPITDDEITLLTLAVQHEIGTNSGYYDSNHQYYWKYYNSAEDFSTLQKYMASTIINRVKDNSGLFPNTVTEVLTQPNQFMPLEELWGLTIDESTRQNVIEVLKGNFYSDVIFEMSWEHSWWNDDQTTLETLSYSDKLSLESQMYEGTSVTIRYNAITTDNRFIRFAALN